MVEALWFVAGSRFFDDAEKERIAEKLATKINKEGCLYVKSSETRSQLENKEIATRKMLDQVTKSLIVPKKRKVTRPSKAARERRLETKKIAAQKKEMRKPPERD